MEQLQNRDSLIFYRSFYEAIKELPQKNQLEIYDAIFELSLNFNEVKLDGISKTVFTLIKPQIQANNKRFINGKQPKTKQEESETEAKQKQEESETEAKQKQEESETEANNNNNNNNNNNENSNQNENKKKSNASVEAIHLIDYFNKVNGTNNTGAKEVINGLNIILKQYTVKDVEKVIDYMNNGISYGWHREKGYNTLSTLSKHTKFYEKLENANLQAVTHSEDIAELQEKAIASWLSIIDDKVKNHGWIGFTEFEIDAIKFRARSYPKMTVYEIENELKYLDKIGMEGKDVENVLRSNYKSLISVKTTLAVENKIIDKKQVRIFDSVELSEIRISKIKKERLQNACR